MSKTQSERIAALEEQVAELRAALMAYPANMAELLTAQLNEVIRPFGERLNEAHHRIDHAGEVFSALRRAVTPKRETSTAYIPAPEFDAAVAELRDECNDPARRFPIATIRERALARRVLRENTAAAGVY